jgi:hypothetical protein
VWRGSGIIGGMLILWVSARRAMTFAAAHSILALLGCTPAADSTASVVAQDVGAVVGSPLPCTVVSAVAQGVSATACGAVSKDVSAVATLVETILAGLPAAPPGMRGQGSPPVQLAVRGPSGSAVTVTLPAMLADLARAAEPELAKVAAAWFTVDQAVLAPAVRVVAAVSEMTDDDTPVLFVPACPKEEADDAAFHYLAADSTGAERAYALVLATPDIPPWDEVSQGAAHEMYEALVDPSCAAYDAGVALSAWVTPRWAGYSYPGPCVVSDDGPDLAPGERDPDGYVMHQDHARSRAAKRERTRLRALLLGGHA